MSETVQYKGVAKKIEIPEGKTANDVAKKILDDMNIEIESYYDDAIECLCKTQYHCYFFHKESNSLYELDNTEYSPGEDVFHAKEKGDGIIEYELKYYNGRIGFNMALTEAFNKLKNEKKGIMDVRKIKPRRDNNEFYGTDFSVPVLIQMGGKATKIVRWSFIENGWVEYTFIDGYKPKDYNYGNDWHYWKYLPIFT